LRQNDPAMIERGPQQHAGHRARRRKRQLPRRRPGERKREDAAEKDEAQNAETHRDQTKAYRTGHA
jgi:hypothetical protein